LQCRQIFVERECPLLPYVDRGYPFHRRAGIVLVSERPQQLVHRLDVGIAELFGLRKGDAVVGVGPHAIDRNGQRHQEGGADDGELGRQTQELHQVHAGPEQDVRRRFHVGWAGDGIVVAIRGRRSPGMSACGRNS